MLTCSRHATNRERRALPAAVVPARMSELAVAPARLVTLPLFEAVTGYGEKAVRRKIEDGIWLCGHEFIKAPDGRILVDMEGYQKWARGQRRA